MLPPLHARYARGRLEEALGDSPVVLVHGPRQCGKTTLCRMVGDARGHAYLSLDDPVLAGAARADPTGFVADLPERVVLDEVQLVPGLFAAIKRAVDGRRVPGRFILTGSANVLLVPRLSDSLAGRMEILRLHPLAQGEIAGVPPRFLERLLAGEPPGIGSGRLGRDLAERVAGGGFPAALVRRPGRRRAAWHRGYLEALVQRDVRDLARIAALDALPRLLQLAAAQSARLVNISALASPFQVSRPTIRDYVTLLERVFLVDLLPPWHSNRVSRLVKTPKLHLGDSGLAAALLGMDADDLWQDRATFGQLLETFVVQELRRQASGLDGRLAFHHYREKGGAEVDVVVERGASELAGIEVKASSTVTEADFRGLRKLREAAGERFKAGVLLYDGDSPATFGDRLRAVPVSALWSPR